MSEIEGTAKKSFVEPPPPEQSKLDMLTVLTVIATNLIAMRESIQRIELELRKTNELRSRMLEVPDKPVTTEPEVTKPESPEATEKAMLLFPTDLIEQLTFTVEGEVVKIKAKKYLETEVFAQAAHIVSEAGGKYISEGKNSRFEIPLSKLVG